MRSKVRSPMPRSFAASGLEGQVEISRSSLTIPPSLHPFAPFRQYRQGDAIRLYAILHETCSKERKKAPQEDFTHPTGPNRRTHTLGVYRYSATSSKKTYHLRRRGAAGAGLGEIAGGISAIAT